MKRFQVLGGFLLAAAMLAPVTVSAGGQNKRYYDRDGHDYHVFDDKEDRAYRIYLTENHREYRAFGKMKPVELREYFKWRHQHSDGVLFKVEIK